MTNNFGFMAQAQRKIEAMQAEAAKVAEAEKILTSIRKDLGIDKSDYITHMSRPMDDETFRNIAERQISDLQEICSNNNFIRSLGLQQYISEELTDIYQSALRLKAGNPDLSPMPCMGYIETLTSPETIEHIDGFGKPLCDGMFRSLIVMAFEIEISNVVNLLADHEKKEHEKKSECGRML